MYDDVKIINNYFRNSTKKDIENLLSNILLSDRQEKIFNMFYIKKQNVGYIADTLFLSEPAIYLELRLIRKKIIKVIPQ